MGEFRRAEQLYREVLAIQEQVFSGKHNPNKAVTVANLAGLYIWMGEFEKADSLFTQLHRSFKR